MLPSPCLLPSSRWSAKPSVDPGFAPFAFAGLDQAHSDITERVGQPVPGPGGAQVSYRLLTDHERFVAPALHFGGEKSR